MVGYASRLLTETEWHYGQIEKEGLTLVWDYEKFHDYLHEP